MGARVYAAGARVYASLFSFSVSPSPFGLDFGTLDFGLGLDNKLPITNCTPIGVQFGF